MNLDPNSALINSSAQSSVQTQNHAPQTEEDPTTGQTGAPDPVRNDSTNIVFSKLPVQSLAEVQTNSTMKPVNGSVASAVSEVPPKDQDPGLNQTRTEPNPVNDSTKSPASDNSEVSYPVHIRNLDKNQTIVLTKPSGLDQSASQSIVVRVPALALLKALVKNNSQTHVRIPLQTQGSGSVLVPSMAPSTIHLTASVQSLIRHPGLVQNNVQSPGIVLSPVQKPGPNPNLVRSPPVQISFPTPASAQTPVPHQVPAKTWVPQPAPTRMPVPHPVPDPAKMSFQTSAPFRSKTPAPNPVLNKTSAPDKGKPAESSSDRGLNPDLFRVPVPPEAVRALSPPPKTTPLKPSVPPLGFRLNGKLITLLPGGEGLEMSVRSHPSGSRSSLTSLHFTKNPPPTVFPEVPRPSVRLPRSSLSVSGESTEKLLETTPTPHKALKKTPAPSPVKITKIQPPPKPSQHVTPLKPCTEKPKAAVAAALLRKGEVIFRRPPDCDVCKGQFNPVPELRGFACMCSSDVNSALQILKLRRKEEKMKFRLKRKLNLLNQQQKVPKPQPFHSYAASKSVSSLQKPLRASAHSLSEARFYASPGVSRPRPSVSPVVVRPRPSTSPGVARPSPSPSPSTSRPHPSPSPGALVRSEVSSPSSGTEVKVGGAVGKLVIHLEDFYYGSAEGVAGLEQPRVYITYRCMQCAEVLPNNISMMQHIKDHMMGHFKGYCSYCFRQFFSSEKLQRHLEVVHGPVSRSSRVVCQICEFEFKDEISLLLHMKDVHKPGEMPYACELCGFRSSFYSQTWKHFEEVHGDTRHLLCQYCLRVFKMERSYQQHVARHLSKVVYSCDRCRLHFHLAKSRQDHQEQHHGTHVRPAQLSGLRPGTKISVRTFQVASSESPVDSPPVQQKPSVAIVPKVQPKQKKACKRKPVESLGQLLAQLHSSECGRCVECLSLFSNFESHFPTRVTCSRCHFQTCCSRSYANHMIDNHSEKRKRPLYPQVFTSHPRSDHSLECLTCGFSCRTGDVMAVHLSKYTKHACLLTEEPEEELSDHEDEQSLVESRGGFVSIEHLGSSNLSVTTLDRPAHLSSPAAMTITVKGPTYPVPKPVAPLTVARLRTLLHSLLYGSLSAFKRFGVTPTQISRWAREQRKTLTNRRWRWDTMGGARWVLTEREQNRMVTQDTILDLSRKALGPKIPIQTRLNWAVDFLLRHDLGVETRSKELRDIGYSVVTTTWDKVSSLFMQPQRFCCLDEFPVFMDPSALSSPDPDALRVWGSKEELPLVEVLLCGSSDGSLLPPMLFYDKDLPPLPLGFPTNIFLQAREGGYSPRERAQLWVDKVWLPHLGNSAPSFLLLDEHRDHMTPDFQEPLQHAGTELVHIPQGCGFLVQPLDQCVAPVVRDFLKVRWSQLVSQSPDFSESDLVLTLACWFSEVCHILNENKDYIHKSFLCVGARYKTAEVSHQTLNQSLYQALIQTVPLASAGSQSEDRNEREEQEIQSETLIETEEVEWSFENHFSPQEQVLDHEVMEVNQSEALDWTKEAGLQPEGQSEAQEGTEEAGLQLDVHSEAGLQSEGQSEAQEGTAEAGLQPEGQSEAKE